MRKILRRVEWVLLIVIGGFSLLFALPSIDLFDHDAELSEAKKKGFYYKVDADKQTYFNKEISIDGVVYGEGKLVVYLSSKRFFSVPQLPNTIQIKTDADEVLQYQSSGASMRLYRSKGQFTFINVPPNLKSVTVFNEAYGESFSFYIPLEEGKAD
ncbi:hypothetical protein AB4Z45_21440 [Paenibacillus sp. MCAF9]|uniref:hypothetical protein n=1 Tax=Paenibacillus sp. MCAF9 TaxID=3233046 RepID=UPI003F9EAAA7